MATATEAAKATMVAPEIGEKRIALRNVNYALYKQICDAVPQRSATRLAFDGKDLEVKTIGTKHEDYSYRLGLLVHVVAFELDIPYEARGSSTWRRDHLERGIEADQCFFFDPIKLEAVERAGESNDAADYPNPDMAVEIDLSPPEIDRPGIYSALQVPEVWRFNGNDLAIDQLGPDGRYASAESSRFLPIRAVEIRRWLVKEYTSDQTAWLRRLRDWVQAELLPRHRAR